MAALLVALDELLPYVHAASQDFIPYLARARNHAEAIDKAFRFRLAFLRRLNNEVTCTVTRVFWTCCEPSTFSLLLSIWRQRLQGAGVDEDVVVDAGVAAKTLKSYAGRLSRFAEFCHDSANISLLEATTATNVRYVASIGERGHIGAKSLQPYLFAINTFFEQHNLDPIAKDSMHLAAARQHQYNFRALVASVVNWYRAEMRVGEAEMRHRHGKMWPCDSHQRHPKAPDGLTWLRVSA
eukprot:jgi/Tetstr1/441711/TSEL_029934.t1